MFAASTLGIRKFVLKYAPTRLQMRSYRILTFLGGKTVYFILMSPAFYRDGVLFLP